MQLSGRPTADAADAMQALACDGATATERFTAFVEHEAFPCVGAKASLSQGNLRILEFGRLGASTNDAPLLDSLAAFARMVDGIDDGDIEVHSLVAVFSGPRDTDETRFETLLWAQLQRLHDLDAARGTPWAADVSPWPSSKHFSMSLAGHPFFVVGLHPGASRIARRFAQPVLVFNSHRQFDRLRREGRFTRMKRAIRKRERALQGSINPNLADHGHASEALQYSGRAVEAGWRCPFRYRGTT